MSHAFLFVAFCDKIDFLLPAFHFFRFVALYLSENTKKGDWPYGGKIKMKSVSLCHTPHKNEIFNGRNKVMRAPLTFLLMFFSLPIFSLSIFAADGPKPGVEYRKLPVSVYRDKMKAGWIGQIAGVCWGAPTEFRWNDEIIPADKVPVWTPEMINNAWGQDDLYVEMTFLRSMEEYGLDVAQRQAGIDFANSGYPLWCANDAGRKNLRRGIAPPDSSHPKFSSRGNDIDYQIEADFAGLIAPGMPNAVIALGEKFGRLMNYGDGVYGGQFMGGMYAEAFFTDDIETIIAAGLACIPADSQYAEMVRDMVAWHRENPNDWEATWKKAVEKYRNNPEYQKASNGTIDVKINGVAVLMGILYGDKDLDKTIVVSMRSGWDSDCNPSSAAGVVFTTLGFSNLPAKFSEKLDLTPKFDFTEYNVPALLAVCEKLTRQILDARGGYIEKNADGGETFCIPVEKVTPSPLELTWAPGPVADSMFTDQEKAKITVHDFSDASMTEAVEKLYSGWTISRCGPDMNPGPRNQYRGRENVLLTHPLDRETSCVFQKEVAVPSDGKTALKLSVSHDLAGDWLLIVRVNGSPQLETVVGPETVAADGWLDATVDLTPFAGQKINVEVENKANGWMCEAGYWSKLAVE